MTVCELEGRLADALAAGRWLVAADYVVQIAQTVSRHQHSPEPSPTAAADVPPWCISLAHRIRGSLGATTGVLAGMIYEEFERQNAGRSIT